MLRDAKTSSKITLGEWLKEWVDASIKPRCRPSTYTRYKGIIENDLLKAQIASLPLQKVRRTSSSITPVRRCRPRR